MSWILDIAAAAVIVLMVIFGVRRGFIKTAVRLIGVIAALVTAALVSTPAAQWIFDTWVALPVRQTVAEAASEVAVSAAATLQEQVAHVVEALPAFVQSAIDVTGACVHQTGAPVAAHTLTTLIMDSLMEPLCVSLMQAMLFLLIAILVYILARILAKTMDKLFNALPIIRQVNGLFGGALGLLEGLAAVYLLTLALKLYMTMTGAGSVVSDADIEATYLVKHFMDVRLLG